VKHEYSEKKMKLAFSSNAFRKYSLVETIKILSDIGYQGIEIMADTPHAYPPDFSHSDADAVLKALQQKNMAVSNINAFMLHAIGDTWRPSWIEPDAAERQKRIDHTLDCIDLAADLGAATLSTEPGGPLEDLTFEEGKSLYKDGLMAVYARAKEKKIKILIEPEPGLLIETSQQFLAFYADLDPEVFGLNFDIGHFFCVGEDPVKLVKQMKSYTCHYHLEDIASTREHHHLMPGAGVIDMSGVLAAISATGYDGFVTVELYPYEEKPIEAARQAYAYLSQVLGGGR
jgi:sugar phosphate isomerase/epimerase